MAEEEVQEVTSSREGLHERLSSGSIPGLFHGFEIRGEYLDITDFQIHPEEGSQPHPEDAGMSSPEQQQHDNSQYRPGPWSLQPRVPGMAEEERMLCDMLAEHRLYNHPRRMRVRLESSIPSYATLNEDVLPEVHEVRPITAIEFEIPADHEQATYGMQQLGSDETELHMTNLKCPKEEAISFETEVTCFHPISRQKRTDKSIAHTMDVYVTKEPMTIISEATSFKNMFDQVAHETVKGKSVDEMSVQPGSRDPSLLEVFWSEEDLPIFRSNMTLVRTDRSGKELRQTMVASHVPSRKSVTRPSADDDFCFVSVNRPDFESLNAIEFMVPEKISRQAMESEAEDQRRKRLTSSDILNLCRSEI
ncbi:hypothetical protein B9479_006594 [Cryptococcus floricola]|uniref:Uncharacterized protein n=1 Tax=Cryptococcus floricola TaxID=2591691 RepID=A0A5D3ART9_9TREE|nr:hypothetical protein B9479_006594 [Cryptococcus floricola]